MPDPGSMPIPSAVLANLYEFPDVCTTRTVVTIPQYPISISLTNVGYETRNKESGGYETRGGTLIDLHFSYITHGSLAQLIDFWDHHKGKLMTFRIPDGHCIRTTIGLQSSLWEFHPFWRFDMDEVTFELDEDRNATNLSMRIKNVIR